MNPIDLEQLFRQLEKNPPPNKIKILKNIILIDFNNVNEKKIDIISQILLRISADAIILSFDFKNKDRDEYKKLFYDIFFKIKSSNILHKSDELRYYFNKYIDYINDFNKNSL